MFIFRRFFRRFFNTSPSRYFLLGESDTSSSRYFLIEESASENFSCCGTQATFENQTYSEHSSPSSSFGENNNLSKRYVVLIPNNYNLYAGGTGAFGWLMFHFAKGELVLQETNAPYRMFRVPNSDQSIMKRLEAAITLKNDQGTEFENEIVELSGKGIHEKGQREPYFDTVGSFEPGQSFVTIYPAGQEKYSEWVKTD